MLLRIAIACSGGGRLDGGEILRRESHIERADRLSDALARPRPDQRLDILALCRDPGDGNLRDAGPLGLGDAAQSAAESGLGLIFLFEDYLRAALEAGTLVPVLEDWWPRFPRPRLYYPGRLHKPPRLRAFLEFLRRDRACTALDEEKRPEKL